MCPEKFQTRSRRGRANTRVRSHDAGISRIRSCAQTRRGVANPKLRFATCRNISQTRARLLKAAQSLLTQLAEIRYSRPSYSQLRVSAAARSSGHRLCELFPCILRVKSPDVTY